MDMDERDGFAIDWERANESLRLPDEALQALKDAERVIRERPQWHARAGEFSRALREADDPFEVLKQIRQWAGTLELGGLHDSLATAAVLLSLLPEAERFYRRIGIPEPIRIDTFGDLGVWMRHFHRLHGQWGLGVPEWLLHHFTCRLFKIGRLQFVQTAWNRQAKVFRNRKTGELAVFPEAGVRLRGDGLADGMNGIFDAENGWQSELRVGGGTIAGHIVGIDGAVRREPALLREDEWELVLEAGSPVLDVHIQAGSKLDPDAIASSMKEAVAFYAAYFPERPVRAFVCTSWLLSPGLVRLLPEGSNIASFARLFRLVPHRDDDAQLRERVFGEDCRDLADAPRTTSLQRTVYDCLAGGGRLFGGSGFRLIAGESP